MYREQDNYSHRTTDRSERTSRHNPKYQRKANYHDEYDDEYHEPARRPLRRANDDGYHRNNYDTRGSSRGYRQKSHKGLIFALVAIGGAAIAAGAYKLMAVNTDAQIVSVSRNYITIREPYQSCHKVGTTTYVQNQKDGTTGAFIGGATGAVAGGIVGNQIHGGGGGTAVGAIVGGAAGALIGRDVQRSNQPDYVAKHGTSNKCATAYRNVKKPAGYNVQYMYKDNMANIIVANQLAAGSKIPFQQLQAMAIQPQ